MLNFSTFYFGIGNGLRAFQICGLARGPPVVAENAVLPPSPVCLILEDDAVLVDAFNERLQQLLDELPRDFHFCSIGYGRPKEALMFEFSEHVVVPSFLWYMTGYLLTLDGVKYLQKLLPIQGPIDTWIGRLMCTNFRSEFQKFDNKDSVISESEELANILQRLHMIESDGPVTGGISRGISRAKMALQMKFRCFAASVPLCSQRVGNEELSREALATNINWRQRDTDITYSGYL